LGSITEEKRGEGKRRDSVYEPEGIEESRLKGQPSHDLTVRIRKWGSLRLGAGVPKREKEGGKREGRYAEKKREGVVKTPRSRKSVIENPVRSLRPGGDKKRKPIDRMRKIRRRSTGGERRLWVPILKQWSERAGPKVIEENLPRRGGKKKKLTYTRKGDSPSSGEWMKESGGGGGRCQYDGGSFIAGGQERAERRPYYHLPVEEKGNERLSVAPRQTNALEGPSADQKREGSDVGGL